MTSFGPDARRVFVAQGDAGALSQTVALGLPFVIGGSIKSIYDVPSGAGSATSLFPTPSRTRMIVCLRTLRHPADLRDRYLAWIDHGRAVREAHGILAELVCEPVGVDGDTVVITVWPDDATFDAWIATPERDAITASDVHQAVDYRPITRHHVVGGYLNLTGLHQASIKEQP